MKGIPECFSIHEALQLPKEIRRALVEVLMNPNNYKSQTYKVGDLELRPHECAMCCATCAAINFIDEELLLGSKPHNHPFFVLGYAREQKIGRILVNGGSTIHIMPKSTMAKIWINMDELSRSHILIQGFNQGRQRVMGMIKIEMAIGELKLSTLFHIIDARTYYSLLLERR
ncbi:hypothetical protein ACFXTH_022913 [Malus domestica]